jgi:hypothetical protein
MTCVIVNQIATCDAESDFDNCWAVSQCRFGHQVYYCKHLGSGAMSKVHVSNSPPPKCHGQSYFLGMHSTQVAGPSSIYQQQVLMRN